MAIWKSGPVEDMPEVRLLNGAIRETDSGNRHFVGCNVLRRQGRISTPIASFNVRTRTGVTKSGRLYRLEGRAGVDSDGEYVWNTVAQLRGIESWRDVTAMVVPDWREPLSLAEREKQMKRRAANRVAND